MKLTHEAAWREWNKAQQTPAPPPAPPKKGLFDQWHNAADCKAAYRLMYAVYSKDSVKMAEINQHLKQKLEEINQFENFLTWVVDNKII